EASNSKLIEMDRAKSDFFANISHELRTPLTLLIGPLDKLRNPAAPFRVSEQMELLDIMYNNAMRLLRLINDLLNLVRLDSGGLTLHKEKIELKALMEGIARSVSSMAEQRRLKFETKILEISPDPIYLDHDKVEKIILNLLFNAFKFTPAGGHVFFQAEHTGDKLEILVRDTGKGISKEELPKIFDRFWQAEGAATRRYQGVGIGLALVKELAQIHGGGVSAESEPDHGTTMRIHLDVSQLPEAPSNEGSPSEMPVQEETSEWLAQLYRRAELFPAHVLTQPDDSQEQASPNSGLPDVLVADDEPEMRRFLKSQLQNFYSVHEAHNGAEALRLAKATDFSLIFLDYMMPEIDGIEATSRLRNDPRTRPVPIIVLTARVDEASKMKALEAGATDFLTKPFASTELIVRSRNLVSAYQLQKQLADKTRQLELALEQIKQTESQLVQHAKMASLGQLSAGLMHEINNPLNYANTALHLFKKRITRLASEEQESLAKPLADLQDGIQRVAGIVSSLRSFTHPDNATFHEVNLLDAIATSARFVQIDPAEILLQIQVEPTISFWGNKNQLIHLFINLLQNSVDSLREKASQTKKIEIQATIQNDEVQVIFYDNGMGISAEDQSRIFDAFFTTKKVGAGVGLGLNICHRIIQQHKARIRVESVKDEFCRFILGFPRLKSPTPL
ncbi:MAG: ATP-binding protein, partial [Methylacidiphilales bacterium]|nr:ATP-binding protein [Candidatus Methylacidiphilales bacterium]